MLPKRPAGLPPRPSSSSQISAPSASGRPPGPPSGPPPRAHVSGAPPAKPPPRGPPPTAPMPTMVGALSASPLQTPPRSPPIDAEEKVPAVSKPMVETQKAPPPPRVAPPASPPPQDARKSPIGDRSPPNRPPGRPPSSPAPSAGPEVTGSSRGPTQPPPALSPGTSAAPTSPVRPSEAAPPGTKRGLPEDAVRAPIGAPSRTLRESPPNPINTLSRPLPRGPQLGHPSAPLRKPIPSGLEAETRQQPRQTFANNALPDVSHVGSQEDSPGLHEQEGVKGGEQMDREGGAVSPPATRVRSLPSSPKAPPGTPPGKPPPRSPPPRSSPPRSPPPRSPPPKSPPSKSSPPKSPPPTIEIAPVPRGNNSGDQAQKKGKLETDLITTSAPQGQQTPTQTLSPGDPGKRRPPPGEPPRKIIRPIHSPPASRPEPPPIEQSAADTSTTQEPVGSGVGGQPLSPSHAPPQVEELTEDGCGDDGGKKEGQIVVGEVEAIRGIDAGVRAKELKDLQRGRLSVRCIEGSDVHKGTRSQASRMVDVYLQMTLGKHERAPTKKSKVVKRSGPNPDFGSEVLLFDIVEPREFVVASDIILSVELWNQDTWSDDLLASVELSALRFMCPDTVPVQEWLSLEPTPNSVKNRMKVKVEMNFEPASVGMFILVLEEGKGIGGDDLPAAAAAAQRNPYVVATLGEMYQVRSRVVTGGGSTPYFKGEEILLWIDKENWTEDLCVQVHGEDIGTDEDLGEVTLSVLEAMAKPPGVVTDQKLSLMREEKSAGQLMVKTAFLPAGKLTIVCEAARELRETSAAASIDPYVLFTIDGQAVTLTRKTKVEKDGGKNPKWHETMEMDIVDQYFISVQCFNHDVINGDELIGAARCSLLPAFKRGTMDIWVKLLTSSGASRPQEAGEVHCIFDFVGSSSVAYPQHQSGVDTFDDSLHASLKGFLDEGEDEGLGREEVDGQTVQSTVTDMPQEGQPLERSTEFSDAEIAAAFKFLDLDHNMRIGAAEIRHILICMGELVTDEEVDMMISMVDLDGDGQVSYEEFYRVVVDPDPSRDDFNAEVKISPKEAVTVSQEMKDRESKRWLIGEFVKENEIRSSDLEMAYKRFQKLAPPGSGGQLATDLFEIDFNTWIQVFDVEATGQYRKLFKLYDITGTKHGTSLELDQERVDIREFFLGVAIFVEWPLQQRARFIFSLFDHDRTGFLSMRELVDILKANHLSTEKGVAKKAQTIMRQADAGGVGTLSMDEFMVVAKKFPNLLFPVQRK